MGPVELVLLDLDGTLLDESLLPDAMRRTCAVVAARVPGLDAASLQTANHAAWGEWWPEVEDEWMLGGETGTALIGEAWRRTLDRLGVADPAVLDLARTVWAREALAAHRLFPDVLPLLDALDAAEVRAGLVSNGAGDLQRAKLAVSGLAGRLDPVLISGEAGTRKPGAEIFEIALAADGTPAGRTLYIGDNLWHDVPGAAAAGLVTLWLDRSGTGTLDGCPTRPDAVIRDLTAVLARVQDPR